MDGMNWIASTMAAAQTRLETATTNLANAHVKGYVAQQFTACYTEHGIVCTMLAAGASTGSRGDRRVPNTDSAHEMVDVLEAQRNFETAQKVALSLDAVRAKEASDVGRAAS